MADSSSEVQTASRALERWAALESNPEVFTDFLHAVGVSSSIAAHDVFGLDDELLAMVPQPAVALVLCFPSREAKKRGLCSRPAADAVPEVSPDFSRPLWFVEQIHSLGNACGTIAMLHAVLNSDVPIVPGSVLAEFASATAVLSIRERAEVLDTHEGIMTAHNAGVVSAAAQTAVAESSSVEHHFVAFVPIEGHVVEFDGAYQARPQVHAAIPDGQTFLQAAATAIRDKYFSRMGDCGGFSLLAVGPSTDDED